MAVTRPLRPTVSASASTARSISLVMSFSSASSIRLLGRVEDTILEEFAALLQLHDLGSGCPSPRICFFELGLDGGDALCEQVMMPAMTWH